MRLDGQQPRSGRDRRRGAEERDLDPATGDVPIGDDPGDLAPLKGAGELAAGQARGPTRRIPTTFRVRTNQAWIAGSSIVSIGVVTGRPERSTR